MILYSIRDHDSERLVSMYSFKPSGPYNSKESLFSTLQLPILHSRPGKPNNCLEQNDTNNILTFVNALQFSYLANIVFNSEIRLNILRDLHGDA